MTFVACSRLAWALAAACVCCAADSMRQAQALPALVLPCTSFELPCDSTTQRFQGVQDRQVGGMLTCPAVRTLDRNRAQDAQGPPT
jgi:hypothetical protein